jgi:hypothetical protein
MKLTQLAIVCSLMGMAAGCAPSAPPPPTPVHVAAPTPTAEQQARCDAEAEKATASMENATERKVQYVHLQWACIQASR